MISILILFVVISNAFTLQTASPGMAELSKKVISWDKMIRPKGKDSGTSGFNRYIINMHIRSH